MALVLRTAAFTLGLNYGVHVLSSKVYDMMCMPHSLQEVLYSIVTAASPACSTLLSVMTATQNNYATVLTATLASSLTSALKYGV